MRSFTIHRASVGLIALALVGLTGCADPQVQGALTSFVAAMRDANTPSKAAEPGLTVPAAAPAPELASLPAPTPTATPAPAASATLSAPAAKAAAAVRPAEPAGPPPSSTELGALQRQLTELESRVAALTADNQRQMERLSLLTNGAIADMEQLFNSLRLELRSAPASDSAPAVRRQERRRPAPAASQTVPSGQGGPFLPWPPKAVASPLSAGDPVEPLLPDLQTLFLLHQIVMALPLSAPLSEAVVTGPFGHRRDPFNRRSAFHDGIDLQAPMRTAIHASASGVVVVAGVRPAYGRVVEIDHGFGIRTRYAHLATLSVREGDRVQRHATIGALGSSGRSASPHLHYEVLFNGRPHDPAALLVLAEGIRTLR